MAILRINRPPTMSREDYERIRERLGLGDGAPDGCQIHVACVDDAGHMRIVEVWEDREQAEAFTKRVMQVREEMGMSGRPDIEYLEVHRIAETAHTHA